MKNLNKYLLSILLIAVAFTAGYKTYESVNPPKVKYVYQEGNSISENVESLNSQIDLQRFWAVWDKIETKYVEENALDGEEALYGAIKGMVDSLDDSYTEFLTPSESEDFQKSLDGELEGIGAELTVEEKQLVVVSPLRDSPAEKAGLLPQDVIYKIDGNLTSEMTLFDAIMGIRGEKDTEVTLTILRESVEEPFDVVIKRGKITIDSVTYELKDENIAYVSINQFSDRTGLELSSIIKDILNDGAKAMILDLRYNSGGYLRGAVDVYSQLTDGKLKVVTLERRDPTKNETYFTKNNSKIDHLPLIILINEGSASASEIVAGAAQDHERGFVIGEQSFGKGTVQEVINLTDKSILRMTVAKWMTPKNRNINKVGITPDMLVRFSPGEAEEDEDPQLDAALDYAKNLIN